MRYEIIQTQPYKDAVFTIRKSNGDDIGKAVQVQKRNNGYTGFELEFLDYQIRMKYMGSLLFEWKKRLKFWTPLSYATYYLFQNGIKYGELCKYPNRTYLMQINGQVYTMCTVGFGSEGIKFPIFEGEFKNTVTRGKQIALIETPNLAQKLNNYQVTALGEWEGLVAALYGIYVDDVTFSINDSYYRKTYLKTFNVQNSLYDPTFKGRIVD